MNIATSHILFPPLEVTALKAANNDKMITSKILTIPIIPIGGVVMSS